MVKAIKNINGDKFNRKNGENQATVHTLIRMFNSLVYNQPSMAVTMMTDSDTIQVSGKKDLISILLEEINIEKLKVVNG